MGRPSQITPEKEEALLEALRNCMPLVLACDLVELPRSSVFSHIRNNALFKIKVKAAKGKAIQSLVGATNKQGGAWKLLKNLGRKHFKEHQEVTLNPTQALVVDSGNGHKDDYSF